MKPVLIGATLAFGLYGAAAQTEWIGTHHTFLPQSIQWGPAPSGLNPNAESALLYGDPKAKGPFVLRVKAPKGYAIGPHAHPQPETITIISGQIRLGLGKQADKNATETLPAGSFSSMPQGVLHYVFVDEDAVIQVNGEGPWGIDYADPKDDPRLQIAPSTLPTH